MRLLIVVACLFPLSCLAEGLKLSDTTDKPGLWLTATLKSYHLNREIHHNETNLGLGLDYHFNPTWRAVAGFYKNSYWVHTNYVGGMWLPLDLTHGFRFGAMGVMASGYTSGDPQRYQPTIVPVFTYEGERFGANLMALVGGPKRGVIGLQVEYKF